MIHGTGSAPGGSLEADFGGDWAITVFLGTRQSDPVPKPLHQRGTGRDPEDWTGCRTGELADEFDVCGRQGPGRWWKGPNSGSALRHAHVFCMTVAGRTKTGGN